MGMRIIGIFDSGIGGRSVEREIRKIAVKNTKYLLGKGATLIVVACNTATVHSIDSKICG